MKTIKEAIYEKLGAGIPGTEIKLSDIESLMREHTKEALIEFRKDVAANADTFGKMDSDDIMQINVLPYLD